MSIPFPTESTQSSYFSPTNCTSSNYEYANYGYQAPKKVETKKERVLRISREKMFASWKVHNQKTESVIQVKQFCKPRHLIGIQKR